MPAAESSFWPAAVASLAILLLAGCGSTETASGSTTAIDAPPSADLEKPFAMRIGDTVRLRKLGCTLSFEDMIEDSRCPTDATCIWAGRAVVGMTIACNSESRSVEVSTEQPTDFSSARVALTQVLPKPRSDVELKASDYEITLVVSPIDEPPTSE